MSNATGSRWRPTPSLVISVVALFVALAGTALALPRNSVRSAQIVNGTVRTVDLRDQAVKTGKIDDGAVGSVQVEDDSLTTQDLGANSVGSSEIVDQSIAGIDIGPNAIGASELAAGSVQASELGTTVVRTGNQAINANSSGGAFINCNAGEQRISGGVSMPGINNVWLQSSFPNGANGWTNIVRNNTAAAINVQPYVLCLVG